MGVVSDENVAVAVNDKDIHMLWVIYDNVITNLYVFRKTVLFDSFVIFDKFGITGLSLGKPQHWRIVEERNIKCKPKRYTYIYLCVCTFSSCSNKIATKKQQNVLVRSGEGNNRELMGYKRDLGPL
ncbi:hypothetical protein DPMN_132487 [Dreissena polymorpha]|uniref:Uncharacterized protein n=1 Tax=Dreissena polymorpha TaxID=45954 RepID=A0A9D4FSL5_DREPO|nr:hypothetical protein DPMN_132487 [Dreissena polymorpha]